MDPFDRTVSRSELSARTAILRASLEKDLVILDSSSRICGAFSEARQFPEEFASKIQQRPPIETRASAYKDAQIVASGQAIPNADFVSWNLLAALASGASVLTTSFGDVDPVLKAMITVVSNIEEATLAVHALLEDQMTLSTWTRTASYLSEHYDLGARLNKIASDLGRGRISPLAPEIGLFARVNSAQEIDALKTTLAGLTPQPTEVHIMTDLHEEARASLAHHAVGRVFLYATSTDSSRIPAATSVASHLICWEPASSMPSDIVSTLRYAANISGAEILALEAPSEPPLPIFRYDRTISPVVQALTSQRIGRTVRQATTSVYSSLDAMLLQGDVQQLVISLPEVAQ